MHRYNNSINRVPISAKMTKQYMWIHDR